MFYWEMELYRIWNFRSERKEDQDIAEIVQENAAADKRFICFL